MNAKLVAIDGARAPDARGRGDISVVGIARALTPDQPIFAEGDRADTVYRVASGAVRTIRLLADGRRQVTDFYLGGDVFGVELRSCYSATAEAVCDSVVISARSSSLTEDPDQPSRLWRYALCELQRSQAHVLTLGRRSALERLARFLVDLADRMGATDRLALPMSRQDIADYLGLTIETVSRTLTQMQAKGLVRLENCRQVRLLKRAALTELCD
jgi:CRP/FNR family transcriptional regulator, nitrogen fixation regulation protein